MLLVCRPVLGGNTSRANSIGFKIMANANGSISELPVVQQTFNQPTLIPVNGFNPINSTYFHPIWYLADLYSV